MSITAIPLDLSTTGDASIWIVPGLGLDDSARVADRVTRTLPNPPSVTDLASSIGMSERTLARHVRARTGQSTLALVQSVRLNRARHLLETTRLSVEQIAEQVGYGDATALWRLMRKVFGLSPSQLRRATVSL